MIDLDGELDLWFSGLGKVRFEFTNTADIMGICRTIGEYVLDGQSSLPGPQSPTQTLTPLPPPAPLQPQAAPQPPPPPR